ncbi:hypothetical protein BD770DRAFT_448273 [Pilaira anomala]|nr:hypothetical protein BD770DRAFT_448273 [Pilaira anomala]
MVEEFNRKIGKAMKKLETLTQVNLINIRTSSYSFGMTEPYAKDRYNLDLELDSNLTFKSQILFDIQHPSFPPDIIIHKLSPELVQNINALLPGEDWNLDQEDCLYKWFERILKLIKKPAPKRRQWSLFEDDMIPGDISSIKQDKSHHLSSPGSSNAKNNISTKRRLETNESLFKTNMEDDFEENIVISKKENRVKLPTYNKDRYRLKNKNQTELDFLKDGKIFEDQDELLSYKTKDETRKVPTTLSKTFRTPFFRGNYPKPHSLDDHITEDFDSEAVATKKYKNGDTKIEHEEDGDDDEPIMLPKPKKMRKLSQAKLLQPTTLQKLKKKVEQNKPISVKSNDPKRDRFEYRKKFMDEWLLKYKRNIMEYDAKEYLRLTLMIEFPLSTKSSLYNLFKKYKEDSVLRFKEENPNFGQFVKPKLVAPVIIHFKMDKSSFPSSKLEIKLISVTNTTSPRSSEPDTMDLNCFVNTAQSFSQIVTNIMQLITDAVPKFHFQLRDE